MMNKRQQKRIKKTKREIHLKGLRRCWQKMKAEERTTLTYEKLLKLILCCVYGECDEPNEYYEST